ncbi:MAG: ABC transporter substrate-binding protein [Tetrasphaera sp.]
MKHRNTLTAVAAVTVASLALAGCGGGSDNPSSSTGGSSGGGAAATKDLEIFSWWTSGSEDAALKSLISAYSKKYPDVKVTNGAVAGGGGGNAQQILQTRIQGGNPPDTFQTHPNESLKVYLDADALEDITSVYDATGLKDKMPADMLKAHENNGDGKYYGLSVGAHRGNVLWYSKPMLEKAQVTEPADGYTPETFLADLQKVKDSGGVPLCLGAKDTFAVAQLFENTLLGTVGKDKWNQLTTGGLQWSDPDVAKAADTFTKIMAFADPDASAMTWDQAIKKLGEGQCAFNSMGDWAYGELVKAGKAEGTDFGYAAHPGTDGTFVLVVDTFAVAKGAKNLENAKNWMAVLADPAAQLEFNKLKGSTPIRNDVDVSSLPKYQQTAAESYRSDGLVWSIAHGQATPPAFQQGFFDAVTQFVSNKDTAAFSQALVSAAG